MGLRNQPCQDTSGAIRAVAGYLGARSDSHSPSLPRQQQSELMERERRASNAGDCPIGLRGQGTSPEEGVGQPDNKE